MNDDIAATKADSILAEERAQRPSWRAPANRRAPWWFRGEELDLVEPAERRQLYLAAKAKVGPVPWTPIVVAPSLLFVDFRRHGAWDWPLALAIAALVIGTAVSVLLRCRLMRRHGRESLRESADWPQRLDAKRQA